MIPIPLEERTVTHVLRRGAQRQPERVAVQDDVRRLTYAELLEVSARVGGGLAGLGVEREDPVLIMLDNSVEHVLAWFGSACLAAVEVPVNTALMAPQVQFIANDCQARVLFVDETYLPRLASIAHDLPHLRHVIVRGDVSKAAGLPFEVHPMADIEAAAPVEPVELAPWDVSAIMYTSGTTGTPKGVLVSHAQTFGRNGPLGPASPRPGDTTLVTLPIYHVIGQCRGLYNTLIAEGTVILQDRFSASGFWDTCRRHGVSYVPLVGIMASYLLAQPPRADDGDNPVERIGLGTTIPEVDAFRERFAIPEVHVSYGLTEAGGVLVGPADGEGCGLLRDDFEARLVDENDFEVAPGEVGELVLRPKEPWTTMLGYFNQPEETAARWRNFWLHTGDLMRQREDGVFVFAGRKAERIRHKGENIYPGSIELELAEHPEIVECAVVGIDSEDPNAAPGDQDILAVVVRSPDSELDGASLVGYLAPRLPYFSVPRYYRFVAELPRTDSTRRVQRKALAAEGSRGAWDAVAAGLGVRRDGTVRRGEVSTARTPGEQVPARG